MSPLLVRRVHVDLLRTGSCLCLCRV
ncbi:putative leader peptide [Cellulomonas sp. APG4]